MNELAQMLEEKRPLFVRLASRYAPVGVDAEDCVQDASMLALRYFDDFEGRSKLSTWFGSIVRNCALMARRRGLHEANDVSLETPVFEDKIVADFIADDATPADRLLDQKRALGMIQRLNGAVRDVMQLQYVDGLTQKEISVRLGMNLGTVKCHRTRGPKRLRKMLNLGVRAL